MDFLRQKKVFSFHLFLHFSVLRWFFWTLTMWSVWGRWCSWSIFALKVVGKSNIYENRKWHQVSFSRTTHEARKSERGAWWQLLLSSKKNSNVSDCRTVVGWMLGTSCVGTYQSDLSQKPNLGAHCCHWFWMYWQAMKYWLCTSSTVLCMLYGFIYYCNCNCRYFIGYYMQVLKWNFMLSVFLTI